MRKCLLLLCVLVVSLGCERVIGELSISSPVSLVTTSGNVAALGTGIYTSELKINNSKKLTLILTNSRQSFDFNISNDSLPKTGMFELSSAQSGQPVDIEGLLETSVRDSAVGERPEDCNFRAPFIGCRVTSDGKETCYTDYRRRMGVRWISYYYRTTKNSIRLTLHNKNLNDKAAEFFSEVESVEEIDIAKSDCREL